MAKSIVMLLGIVLVVAGVLGFFTDPVLGTFAVNGMNNALHIIAGVLALAMASMGARSAKTYGKIFGVIYLVLGILGFVMGTDTKLLGLFEVNTADNFLFTILGLVLLFIGFSKAAASSSPRPMSGTPM